MTTIHPVNRVRAADCRLDDFVATLDPGLADADYPHASRIEAGVVIYAADTVRDAIAAPDGRDRLRDELVHALLDGPGIVVFTGAFGEAERLADSTDAFTAMVAEQRAAGSGAGDHFAAPARTTASGMPCRSLPCAIRNCSPTTTATTFWP